MTRLRLGTRGSMLALIQSELVAARLRGLGIAVEIVRIVTEGDVRALDSPIGDGVFVADIEDALVRGEIDIAVHSAKDLPLTLHPALTIGAYPERADPRDALVTRSNQTYVYDLPMGARVGTDSARRSAFLHASRPDLQVIPLMGNVDVRVHRLDAGEADALVLAVAGLDRLGLGARASVQLDPSLMPPAPAQGALAVEARRGDTRVLTFLNEIDEASVRSAVVFERAVLMAVGGGCNAPVGVVATASPGGGLRVIAGAATLDGSSSYVLTRDIPDELQDRATAAFEIAAELHENVPVLSRAILDTRPDQDPADRDMLNRLGFRVLHAPTVTVMQLDCTDELTQARDRLGSYDWVVLTSKRGVSALFDGWSVPLPATVRVAAVGPSTAQALRSRGIRVDAQPTVAVGDAIPGAMAGCGLDQGDRVLLARANSAGQGLPDQLRRRGAIVDDVVAYRTVSGPTSSRAPLRTALQDPQLEAVIFASGSAVRGFVELTRDCALPGLRFFTIGPATSAAVRSSGLQVAGEAGVPSIEAVCSAIRANHLKEVSRWLDSR